MKNALVPLGEQQSLWADTSYALLLRALFTADSEVSARKMKPTLGMTYLCLYSSADYLSGCSDLSVRQIGERIGTTEKTANRMVHKLEELGLVKIRKRGGKKPNIYQIVNKVPLYRTTRLNKDETKKEFLGFLEWKHQPRETGNYLKEIKKTLVSNTITPEQKKEGLTFVQVNIQVNIHNYGNQPPKVETQSNTDLETLDALPYFEGKEAIYRVLRGDDIQGDDDGT